MKEILYKHQNVENSLLKDYTICQKIGEGASSLVYRAFDTNTKNYYAIKAIPKEYLNSDLKLKELIKTQIYILKTCNNRNVLKCYEVLQSPDSIFIVTQLCDDSMENLLQTQKSFSEDQAVMYLRQILNGFKGLHDLGAMHRDFKLANVLLNKQTCKIGDFGYAKRMNKQDITFTVLGTKVTMAPEVIERKGYGFSADIWSLGVVFYQMLYGIYPYIGQNQFELLQKIKTQKIDYSSKRITPQAKDFIERCLTYKPQKRITWSQIYLHPLINRQSIQILYNIWNPKENLNENSKFYQKNQLQKQQQFEKETISGSIIMKDSHRKKLIMKQIQQVINKKIQKKERDGSNIMKFKKNQIEKEYVILRSAKLYIVYINKLCYPLKFLREQLIKRRIQKINSYKNEKQNQQKLSRQHIYSNNQYLLPQYNSTKNKFEQSYQGNVQRGKSSSKLTTPKNSIKRATSFQQLISDNPKLNEGKYKVQVQSLIYLMYKKSYCELVQRYKMIKIKKNIFKITSHWEELCNSAYYKQIIGIISYQLEKIEKIVRIYEKKACWSNIQEISQFALKKEDNLGQIQRLCKKYLQEGAKYIFQYFKQAQVQKGRQYQNLIQFMEGLLYCLAPEDDDNKITPEQFHEKMSCPFNVMKAKVEILQRYEIYSKFN